MKPRQIIILVIVILLLVILFQNLDIIPVQILLWTVHISLLLVILLPFILGIIVGWLLKTSMVRQKKQKAQAV